MSTLGKDVLYSLLVGGGASLAVSAILMAGVAAVLGDAGFALDQLKPAVLAALPAGVVTAIFDFSARRKRRPIAT